MWHQQVKPPNVPPLLQWQGLAILPGLNAVTGDEGSGKTRLLRELCESVPDALWLDLRLPEHDAHTPEEIWTRLRTHWPPWNTALQADLTDALQLQEHLGKRLFMLSTGSRRKVALVGLLASGATVTGIDQPYAALDLASVKVIREVLEEAAQHTSRAWVVADYEPDPALPWHSTTHL